MLINNPHKAVYDPAAAFPLFDATELPEHPTPEDALSTVKPHSQVMNSGLVEAVRRTVGLVTQQLC